ncbi:MAG: DEAD/DEAH box helicase [Bacilli bacterium]
MKFSELGLKEPILKNIIESGYTIPTPIQEACIPQVLNNKDILGCARTGTGKTAAFALPILDKLLDKTNNPKVIKALILTPTRELAIQIRDNFRNYGEKTPIKCSVIFGGVNQKSQVEVLKKGVDILVATPGRLLDLINQKYVKLNNLEILVLDEADTMLDMGFIHDVKKILNNVPNNRQTLLFSATMPKSIDELAQSFLTNPITIKVDSTSEPAPKINQSVYYIDNNNKAKLLTEIIKGGNVKSGLVFTRTKHGADKLAKILELANISVSVIHGNKSQNARVTALDNFKTGKSKIMVATDIAARGIDINELSHVFNYEIPELPETYIHRIGRTARAGLDGKAISFCDIDEKSNFKEIEKLIGNEVKEVTDHKYPMEVFTLTPKKATGRNNHSTFNKPKNNIAAKNDYKNNNKSNGKTYFGSNQSTNNYSQRPPKFNRHK